MLLLVVSVLAFAAGPVVVRLARPARPWLAAVDGFVVTAIGGLVLVHTLPEAVVAAGIAAVVLALVGFVGPSAVEHLLHGAARRAHDATVALATAGLAVHAFFDGVALSASSHGDHSGSLLGLAIVLHRVPMAITVWILLEPVAGVRGAGLAMVSLAAATVFGYALGDQLLPYASAGWLGLIQALVAGSLLHVVLHRAPLHKPRARTERLPAVLGGVCGLSLVGLLALAHDPLRVFTEHELDTAQGAALLALVAVFAVLVIRRATGGGHDHAHHDGDGAHGARGHHHPGHDYASHDHGASAPELSGPGGGDRADPAGSVRRPDNGHELHRPD